MDTAKSSSESEFETITEHFHQKKSPIQITERCLRSTSAKRAEEAAAARTTTSESTAVGITPQAVDITPVDHGARRLSWSRLILTKQDDSTPKGGSEQFEENMRTLAVCARRQQSNMKLRSSISQLPPERKIDVQIIVQNLELKAQPDLEFQQTIIYQNDVEGIDLNESIKFAMNYYKLDPIYNIQVDYWSNSL